jgi:copper chaperone CopZ
MQRRRFMTVFPLLGVGSLAPAALLHGAATDTATVKFAVKGFTCITCAVGLETLLQREHGVVSARASYVPATATIEYHPKLVDADKLRGFIEEAGFTASLTS